MVDVVKKYFPSINELQVRQFEALGVLYPDWNEKINVISRKDIENLYVNHILHSLSVAEFFTPVSGTRFLDLGTGGGFPGIPLAILWPECEFHLIDRIGKKLTVASSIAETIGLENVSFQHGDVSECKQKFDFVISRAVMKLEDLVKLSKKHVSKESRNAFPNGLICLKGGNLDGEVAAIKQPYLEYDLSAYFDEPFYNTKKLVYVTL